MTVFQAASVSKPTAAMAVMLLAERQALKLDDEVNLALRSWKLPDSKVQSGEPVTLRRLLSHSAGISVHGFGGYAAGEKLPRLTDILKGRPPANSAPVVIEIKPGERFQYSGGGYCIIQQVLEDVEKRPFEDVMESLVLKPCGMNHSSYDQPLKSPLAKNQASGHDGQGKTIAGGAHVYPEQAAAGLWTTAADYASLLLAIDRSLTGAAPEVFSKALVQEMMTVQKGGHGLGWEVGQYSGHATLSHGGVNEGFQCYVWLCPSLGQGLVVFTNSDNGLAMINDISEPLRSGRLR